jgi:hypothetical protein
MKPLRERETPRAEGAGEANRHNDHRIDFAERPRTPWKVSQDSAMDCSLCSSDGLPSLTADAFRPGFTVGVEPPPGSEG